MTTTKYGNSHALVIGINSYKYAAPLGYAVNDAQEIAATLQKRFNFLPRNITLLLDKQASRKAILEKYLKYAIDGTKEDDRLIVFFAGHGMTEKSKRQEVGFLVPHDGNPKEISSLIRWDELTRNADLIKAKHIFFIMDACYGGLAITRTLKPGAARFLADMLTRPAQQVLTAGKADEVVADLGGPREGHSVFTGHLLDGLEGKAEDTPGVLTANGLMAYVYQMVGQDKDSRQTPHYGYLEGDGDFVFLPKAIGDDSDEDTKKGDSQLVTVPTVAVDQGGSVEKTNAELIKEYLSEERFKIKLHDRMVQQTREFISLTTEDKISMQGLWASDEFSDRLKKYEEYTHSLRESEMLICYWGGQSQHEIMSLPIQRIANKLKITGGLQAWLRLRWYPVLLLIYGSGIAACTSNKYENLRVILQSRIVDHDHVDKTLATGTIAGKIYFDLVDLFKTIPGHERHYTPISEYLFKFLQSDFNDLLFLGDEYESYFDRFEVLFSLEFAEQFSRENDREVFGPLGRFAWKFKRGFGGGPLKTVMLEAERLKDKWPPIQAGMFNGSYGRFETVAKSVETNLARLGWW